MQNVYSRSQLGLAIVLLVIANLLWAGQGVAVKMLSGRMAPIPIALLPLYLATLLISPVILWKLRSDRCRLTAAWKHRNQFLIAGVGGQLVAQVGMTLGISWSLASNGAILNLLIPILSALIASLLLRERLTLLRVGALLLGLCGVILLSPLHSSTLTGSATHRLVGNLFIACGCLGSAFYNVYSKRLLSDFSEVETLFFSYLAATVSSIPMLFRLYPGCLAHFSTFTSREWAAFSFLAIFMYGVSMLLFFHALRHVSIIVAAASLYLVPVFGMVLAVTVLREQIEPRGIFGFGIVLLGMLAVLRNDYAV